MSEGSIAHSLSLSSTHSPDMTVEKDVKSQVIHPTIHLAPSSSRAKFLCPRVGHVREQDRTPLGTQFELTLNQR